jgi:protein-S-isoprenylcysteine O-methyltransferase Ste14
MRSRIRASDPHAASPLAGEAPAGGLAVPLFAVAGLLATGTSIAYFLGFLDGLGPWPSIDSAGPAPVVAAAVDLGLILLFGLQHSVMARPAFKRRWTRLCPPAAERSAYLVASSAALFLLCLAWQPIPAPLWHVETGWLRAGLWSLHAGGAVLLLSASLYIDPLGFTGIRQALEHAGWLRRGADGGLVTRGLYRLVRHPIQTGWLLILWAAPTMSWGHLLLSAALTAYIAIGTRYEERDLEARFGDAYRRYRQRTGAFAPRPPGQDAP